MKKSGVAPSPVVPGRYFVFVERLVREQYQTVVVDAPSEDAAGRQASMSIDHLDTAASPDPTDLPLFATTPTPRRT